jgi:hypothetical protein
MRSTPRIGYVPLSRDLRRPGDRRRFVGYAGRRNLNFELAVPTEIYDVVVLTQQADITTWTNYPHGKIVYDLVDSYLGIPRSDVKQLLRGSAKYLAGEFKRLRFDYKGAVQDMCRRADAVICTTTEQQQEIERVCKNVHIALDFHSSVTNRYKTDYRCHSPIRIVWEGLGVNVPQLAVIREALKSLAASNEIVLVLVTDLISYRWMNRLGRVNTNDVARRIFEPVSIHPWTEETCADLICECDIGVIPLDLSNKFIAGKPENKLLLLWRMGMPVIASATPAYMRAMKAAGTPELACARADDWVVAFSNLIADEQARRRAGMSGRALANNAWSEDALLGRWDNAMASIGLQVLG